MQKCKKTKIKNFLLDVYTVRAAGFIFGSFAVLVFSKKTTILSFSLTVIYF